MMLPQMHAREAHDAQCSGVHMSWCLGACLFSITTLKLFFHGSTSHHLVWRLRGVWHNERVVNGFVSQLGLSISWMDLV